LNQNMRIRDIVAEPGTKKTGFLQIADLYGYGLKIPLMIVNGKTDGSVLSVVAGTHGCEYAGIETVMRLFTKLDPNSLKGALLLVPIVNMPGFLGRFAYVNPIDELNIDSLFDGAGAKPHAPKLGRAYGIYTSSLIYPYGIKGSVSELMADALYGEVVSKSNYVIDLHGGDFPEEVEDRVAISNTANKTVDSMSESLGRCFGVRYMFSDDAQNSGGGLVGKANRAKIAGVVAKAGDSGKLQEEAVELLYEGTLNALKYLKMLDGTAKLGNPKTIKVRHIIKSNHAGVYIPKRRTGDLVNKGDAIGIVHDLFGKVVDELRAPASGLLYFQHYNPSVLPGDIIWMLGEV